MPKHEPEQTPAVFRSQLAKAEITHADFARFIGRDPVTIYRWLAGDLKIPDYAWIALSSALNTLNQYKPKRKKA